MSFWKPEHSPSKPVNLHSSVRAGPFRCEWWAPELSTNFEKSSFWYFAMEQVLPRSRRAERVSILCLQFKNRSRFVLRRRGTQAHPKTATLHQVRNNPLDPLPSLPPSLPPSLKKFSLIELRSQANRRFAEKFAQVNKTRRKKCVQSSWLEGSWLGGPSHMSDGHS